MQNATTRARRWAAGSVAAALVAGAPLAAVATAPAQAAAPTQVVVTQTATHAAAKTSKVNGKISRKEVLSRAKVWVKLGPKISYSQVHRYPNDKPGHYRKDCSGFVSMALHLSTEPGGGRNTDTLRDVVHPIKKNSLKPGDLVGKLGNGTLGNLGHVQIFIRWTSKSHKKLVVAETGVLGSGPSYPHYKTYTWAPHFRNGTKLSAYRYNKITG